MALCLKALLAVDGKHDLRANPLPMQNNKQSDRGPAGTVEQEWQVWIIEASHVGGRDTRAKIVPDGLFKHSAPEAPYSRAWPGQGAFLLCADRCS